MSTSQPAGTAIHLTPHSRSAEQAGRLDWLQYAVPVVLVLLIMLPRLLDPHFGLMDDGANLTRAQEITSGQLGLNYDGETGRFRPIYWLFVAGQYALFGLNPLGFFLTSTLVLAATTITLVAFLGRLGAGRWQSLLGGALFVLSVPVIENFYTLGKGEPLQTLFIALSLLVLAGPAAGSRGRSAIRVAVSALFIFLSTLNKETTLVLLPIAIGWAALGWILPRQGRSAARFRPLEYLGAAVLGLGVFYLMRSLAVQGGLQSGSYTSGYAFTGEAISAALVRWAGWLARGFGFLAPLALLAAVWVAARRELPSRRLALFALVWMGGWLVVFLPWRFAQEYYLLPFAGGAAVLSSALLPASIQGLRASAGWRSASLAALALSAVLFLTTLATNASNARVQLVTDRANWEILEAASRLPRDSRLLINIRLPNEYSDAIALYLAEILERPDLEVTTVPPQGMDAAGSPSSSALLTPYVENQPLLTVRLGVVESSLHDWNAALRAEAGSLPAPIFSNRHGFRNLSVDLPRLFCALIPTRGYCASSQPLLDRRVFSYGWDLYRLP